MWRMTVLGGMGGGSAGGGGPEALGGTAAVSAGLAAGFAVGLGAGGFWASVGPALGLLVGAPILEGGGSLAGAGPHAGRDARNAETARAKAPERPIEGLERGSMGSAGRGRGAL